MREVYISEIREKIREVDSIDGSLTSMGENSKAPEVEKVRKRLEGLLTNVRNPEEDDRIIKQFCYSLPGLGNMMYFIYTVWKKADPTLQDRVHSRLNFITRQAGNNSLTPKIIAFFAACLLLIGFFGHYSAYL